MAGDHAAESQFTGMAKYFNSTTIRGRANVSRLLGLLELLVNS
jgi:hypothetical protein